MTIISEFLKGLPKYGCNIALASEEEGEISYNQLANFSNFIAGKLIPYSGQVKVVGVLLERSFGFVASMLGIMRTGMAYLPLDPSYPVERIQLMLAQANTTVVLCSEFTKDMLDSSYRKILVSQLCGSKEPDIMHCEEKDMACVLYTSGSTGRPNGVVMTHEAIVNTLKWFVDFYSLNEHDVDMQIPSCSYTSSVEDIFTTLLSGGKLVILNEKKILNMRYLKMISDKYHVTHFDMVPSLYREYLRGIKNQGTLRFVLLAGEALSYKIIENHFKKLPSVRLINEYGMAESCATCFVKEISGIESIVSIGKPITNMDYKIDNIDSEGVGELLLCGKGLAAGYYNNSELTNEKFITKDKIRYLRTGDFVKVDENADVIYVGRKDNQIKVNGKRVNLAEIDFVLQRDDNVIDSVTTTVFYRDKQLIVSFILPDSNSRNTEEDYYQLINKHLPVQYVPNYINIVKEFLHLPNWKINLKEMKEMFIERLEKELMESDNVYKKLVDIIGQETKGLLKELVIDKDLREQGIDSLSFIGLMATIEEQFDFEFGYDDLDNLKPVSIRTLYDYISSIKGD